MKKSEGIVAFTAGFAGYPLLELLWRGRTHWSMALAGGVAGLLLYPLCVKKGARWICCKTAAVITAVELVFGCIFNLLLKQNVWDYSKKPLNFLGQICLPYCCLWFLMGVPVRWLCRGIRQICEKM